MSTSREIAVLAPHRHPRLRYVLAQLSAWWGVKLRLFTNPEHYCAHPAPLGRINYGAVPTGKRELQLFAHRFVAGGSLDPLDLKVARNHKSSQETKSPRFFLNPASSGSEQTSYDPFAIIFFCLSRYEEYNSTDKYDQHGRFPGQASHAFRAGYLKYPIINFHLREVAEGLNHLFADCHLKLPPASLQLTYDVDLPFAYRLRGWRGLASGLRDVVNGNRGRALRRFKALFSAAQPDPYDVFDRLERLHSKHAIRPRFFWLLAADRTKFDPNPDPTNPTLHQLICRTATRADIGIHPSYYASDRPALVKAEKNRLRNILEQPVKHSRQHFLRFQLPSTYRQLLLAGLDGDHSMGYADLVGYRAGTNLPFRWYDLEREKMTHLRVYPFAAMDVSLLKYEKLSYFDSQKKLHSMAQDVRNTGGPFTLLWHNSSFAEDFGWAGWGEMYETLVGELSELLR